MNIMNARDSVNSVKWPSEVIEGGGYQFTVKVYESRHPATGKPTKYGVRVGGNMESGGCVSITVTAPQEDEYLKTALKPHVAGLNLVMYAPCAGGLGPPAPPLGNESRRVSCLERGGAGGPKPPTTAEMLRAAFRYVVITFNWVRMFRFSDTSTVVCGSNPRLVPLPELSLCHLGETWYERTFKARLEVAADHVAYRKLVHTFLQTEEAKPASFEDFCASAHVPAAVREVLQPAYTGAATLQECFAKLYESQHHDNNMPFCSLVSPWVADFLNTVLHSLHRRVWLIDATEPLIAAFVDAGDKHCYCSPICGLFPICSYEMHETTPQRNMLLPSEEV